jgi:hypothetical protein
MVVEGTPTIFRREIQEMETQNVFLTDDGRQRAVSQLEFLRTVRRAEVAQYLHDAKESGDVIDNAAYEDAKRPIRARGAFPMNLRSVKHCWVTE